MMMIATLLIIFSLTRVISSNKFVGLLSSVLRNVRSENISEECVQQLQAFGTGLQNSEIWALQMFDAMSKIPPGILSDNFVDLGSFDQCLTTSSPDSRIQGKYSLGNMNITLPKNLQKLQKVANSSGAYVSGRWAVCFPSACLGQEFVSAVSAVISEFVGYESELSVDETVCQTLNEKQPHITTAAILTITVFSAMGLTMVVSTVYDILLFYKQRTPTHVLLVAFSALTNGRKILQVNPNSEIQIPCLNGIKTLSTMWIVFMHTYSIFAHSAVANMNDFYKWTDSLHSMLVPAGVLSTDTFFMIGGFLAVNAFLKARDKGVPFNLLKYYIHRYIRLTPVIAAGVMAHATILEHFGSGPLWPQFKLKHLQPCQEHVLSTFFYMQNYLNPTTMCMAVTWYLDVDMHLYLLSPVIFLPLWKWRKLRLGVVGILIMLPICISFGITWKYQLHAMARDYFIMDHSYRNLYYIKTHCRASTWLLGVMLGYIMYDVKSRKKVLNIGKILNIFMWITAFTILLTCVLVGHNTLREGDYDQWRNALYIALVTPLWTAAFCWIVFACSFGYGGRINWFLSLPAFEVTNRLCYSVYVLHYTVMSIASNSTKVPIWFSDGNMIQHFWFYIWLTTCIAIFWVLVFEYPMIAIERYALGGKKSKSTPHSKPVEAAANLM